MRFNTRTRYGLRTMVEIASSSEEGEGVFQNDIAQKQQISVKYLDQIISALKTASLITNVKGKKSGYILTRPASEITMYDILLAFQPELAIADCLDHSYTCPLEGICTVHPFWSGLNDNIVEYFRSRTLDQFLQLAEQEPESTAKS